MLRSTVPTSFADSLSHMLSIVQFKMAILRFVPPAVLYVEVAANTAKRVNLAKCHVARRRPNPTSFVDPAVPSAPLDAPILVVDGSFISMQPRTLM